MPTIRPATAADADAAQAVCERGFATYERFGVEGYRPPMETAHDLRARLLNGWGAVAEHDRAVVGFAAAEAAREEVRTGALVPGLAHVWAVFVDEAHWGDGTAAALLAAVTAEGRSRGFTEGRLYTPALQERARRFYAREGWTEQGPPELVEHLGLELVELRAPLGS